MIVIGLALGLFLPGARSTAQDLIRTPAQARALEQALKVLARDSPGDAGHKYLVELARVKGGVPSTDRKLQRNVQALREKIQESTDYRPYRGDSAVYEAGVAAMLLSSIDPGAMGIPRDVLAGEIQRIVDYIQLTQNSNGSWDYVFRDSGDCSITQYGLLGLWEAEGAGARVNPAVWERVARFYIDSQEANGGWVYHPGETRQETMTMTAAGVSSLLLCRDQLNKYRERQGLVSELLTPVDPELRTLKYRPALRNRVIEESARRGAAWIARNFDPSMRSAAIGPSAAYALYGIERLVAFNEDLPWRSEALRWYQLGANYLLQIQASNGAFGGGARNSYGPTANTCWGVLFLSQATTKAVKRRRGGLGAGTLIGGRGLPADLDNLVEAGGRIFVRPLEGAIDGLLGVLEDPRNLEADRAYAGIVEQYDRQGPEAIRPYRDRFIGLLDDPDPGIRQVAIWALARSEDLKAVPPLIKVLREDRDPRVTIAASVGLRLISRKIEGFGLQAHSPRAERQRIAALWDGWFESINPLESSYVLEFDDDPMPADDADDASETGTEAEPQAEQGSSSQ